MIPACPIGMGQDHIPTTLPTYTQQHGCAQLHACSVPFPCTHPPGCAAAPVTARVPEAAGGGSSACTQEELCFWLLESLCSPARLAFVPVCSVRLRSRNPHPVPGDGNPTTSTQKRNLREGVGLFMPLCANPGDGRTLLRKCRDPNRRAPRASPRGSGQISAPRFPRSPRHLEPGSVPSRLPPPSRPSRRAARAARRSLPGAGSAPASVRAAPPAAACCRSHLRGRGARCAVGAGRSPRVYRPSGTGEPRSPLRAAARSARRPQSPLVLRPERRGEQEQREEREEEEERERSREKEESGGRG